MNPLEIIQKVYGEEYQFGEKELSLLYEVVKLATRNCVEWQPIETAPRCGSIFLIFAGGVVGTGFWNDEYSDWELCAYLLGAEEVTHWMPLPEPPEE